MIGKINEFRDSLKTLKELEKNILDLDIESFNNINVDDLNKVFINNFKQKVKLRYRLDSENTEPMYAYETDSGFDLRANETVKLSPFGRALIPTGLYLDVPEKCEIQVRPKSGLAIKKGLSVLNTPGTVDFGYTGEIKVIVFNFNDTEQIIYKGDKIAQAVVCPVIQGKEIDLIRVDKIEEKDRNENGFGSTGN